MSSVNRCLDGVHVSSGSNHHIHENRLLHKLKREEVNSSYSKCIGRSQASISTLSIACCASYGHDHVVHFPPFHCKRNIFPPQPSLSGCILVVPTHAGSMSTLFVPFLNRLLRQLRPHLASLPSLGFFRCVGHSLRRRTMPQVCNGRFPRELACKLV
jgi:hypothetical protein